MNCGAMVPERELSASLIRGVVDLFVERTLHVHMSGGSPGMLSICNRV
jgi:hypothetical protein